LHTAPDGPRWLLARACWLPLLALVLVMLVRRRPERSAAAPRRDVPAECERPSARVYDVHRSEPAERRR
ncbi:hypothetical protein ACFQZ8_06745, partial [Micromonospora azadirachtae]